MLLMPDDETTLLDAPQPGLRDDIELGGQAGLATYVAAAIFGSTSMPRETPDWMKVAVESQANFAQRLPGAAEMTIGGAGGGPLDVKTRQERQHDAEEDSTEYLISMVERIDHERERQHETQWLTETHAYAGKAMTGEEWHEMIGWFRDAANVAGWEEAMMAETGESREEVRRTGGKMKRFYDLMDKDAKGTLTDKERTEFDALQRDKEVKRGIEVQQELQGLRAERGIIHREQTDARMAGSQSESVADRSDLYADEAASAKGLAAVEPLSPIHRRASDASQTVEAPAPLKAAAPVAANTVTVSPANMFG